MKNVKVKLASAIQKPVNFKFGEVNILVLKTPTIIGESYATAIMAQYPGWIEVVPKPEKRATKAIKAAKEA